ncbi:hypothetical protein F4776DRAFT_660428 [Hypoxylon sp. NC0597]|nr:hypothetical protein F4776DRAFT_660428 [Hypoxylon sp. NC0597]
MEQDGLLINGSNSEENVSSNPMPAIQKGSLVTDGHVCRCFSSVDDVISHDLFSSRYHTSYLGWFGTLTKAIEAAWPTRDVTSYSDVHVLMFSWAENDIPNLGREITRLESIFRDCYGYNTSQVTIPVSKADFRVRKVVDSFIEENDKPDNLLIVYYAGHARLGTYKDSPPIWYSKNPVDKETVPSFDTANIQPVLTRAQDDSPDVLLIYDCCHAAHSPPRKDKPSRAVVECLFAGGSESRVPTAGPDSFTAALTNELAIAAESRTPISVVNLHQRIMRRLQLWTPTPLFYENGTVRRDNNGNIILTKDNRATPVYMVLSTNEEPRTIFLAPKKKQVSYQAATQDTQITGRSEAEESELPRVLLAIRLLDDNEIHAKELERWVLKAPGCVVKFERIYQSYSKLLLVELSLPIWDLLPRNPAVTFVGFTRGTDPVGSEEKLSTTESDSVEDTRQLTQSSSGSIVNQALRNTSTDDPMAHITLNMRNLDEREDRRLVALLNAVDRVLPVIFNNTEGNQDEVGLEWVFSRVLGQLNDFQEPGGVKVVSNDVILQYKSFLLRYIISRHLVTYDQPWLGVSNRLTGPLARLFEPYDDEKRADATSIPEISHSVSEPSTYCSKIWSVQSSSMTSSMIASSMLDAIDTPIEVVSQKKALDLKEDDPTRNASSEEARGRLDLIRNEIPASNVSYDSNISHPYTTESSAPKLQMKRDDTKGTVRDALETQKPTQGEPHNSQSNSTRQDAPTIVSITQSRSSESLNTHHNVSFSRNIENEKKSSQLRREPIGASFAMESSEHPEELDYPSNKQKLVEVESLVPGKEVSTPKAIQQRGSEVFSENPSVESTKSEHLLEIATRTTSPPFNQQVDCISDKSESDFSEIDDAEFGSSTIKSRQPKSIDDSVETASLLSYVYPSEPADEYRLGGISPETKDVEEILDTQYHVHRDTDFQPGRVFKILWSEPTSARSSEAKDGRSSKFYVGFRRFIIVATDEEAGHSTCVPILTYERRGCTKSGVNPNTHGIIYSLSNHSEKREPSLLEGEPELGFPPIRVDGYIDEKVLPKESRVNYAKLVTIEHNVKVFFIGFIPLEDFPKMVHAVNECWEEGLRKAKQKTKRLTSSITGRS